MQSSRSNGTADTTAASHPDPENISDPSYTVLPEAQEVSSTEQWSAETTMSHSKSFMPEIFNSFCFQQFDPDMPDLAGEGWLNSAQSPISGPGNMDHHTSNVSLNPYVLAPAQSETMARPIEHEIYPAQLVDFRDTNHDVAESAMSKDTNLAIDVPYELVDEL